MTMTMTMTMTMMMMMMTMTMTMTMMMDHINVQDNPIHLKCFPRAAHRRRCVNLLNQIQAIRTLGPYWDHLTKESATPALSTANILHETF
jgi:hypothetical protein